MCRRTSGVMRRRTITARGLLTWRQTTGWRCCPRAPACGCGGPSEGQSVGRGVPRRPSALARACPTWPCLPAEAHCGGRLRCLGQVCARRAARGGLAAVAVVGGAPAGPAQPLGAQVGAAPVGRCLLPASACVRANPARARGRPTLPRLTAMPARPCPMLQRPGDGGAAAADRGPPAVQLHAPCSRGGGSSRGGMAEPRRHGALLLRGSCARGRSGAGGARCGVSAAAAHGLPLSTCGMRGVVD